MFAENVALYNFHVIVFAIPVKTYIYIYIYIYSPSG